MLSSSDVGPTTEDSSPLAALADASWAVYYVAVLAFLLRNQYVISIRLAAGLFEYAYGPFPKDIDQLNGIA